MPTPSPRAIANAFAWAFLCGVMIVVAGVVATGVALPQCGLCHSESAFHSATSTSAHGRVDCAACHVAPGAVARISFAFQHVTHVFGPSRSSLAGGSASVDDGRCLSCHQAVEDTVSSSRGLRIKHAVCSKGTSCTDCHSATAHGNQTKWPRLATMDQCLHCHSANPKLSKCNLCHAGRDVRQRLTAGPWTITHGPNWRQTHGMGDQLTCATCHAKGFCDKCHGPGLPHTASFRLTHPTVAASPGAKCYTCHKSTFCTDCHGLLMPHPLAFIKTHSTVVKANGRTLCQRCHAEDDCTTCHVRHVHPGGSVDTGSGTRVVQ